MKFVPEVKEGPLLGKNTASKKSPKLPEVPALKALENKSPRSVLDTILFPSKSSLLNPNDAADCEVMNPDDDI